MNFETLSVREDNGALFVTFKNPPINLISIKMVQELFQLGGSLMPRSDIKVIVLDSADPDFFLAHFDLDELEASAQNASRYPDVNALQAVSLVWQGLPQVTIAKVDGRVRGGGLEFILALDMRFCTKRSLLGFPEASGAFLASGGGTTRTFIAAGGARALEILLSSRDFSGEEAERYGLVNRALEADAFEGYIADLVDRLRLRSPEVIAMHRAVFAKMTAPMTDTFFSALAAENDGINLSMASGELQAGAARHRAAGQTRENELDLPAFMARVVIQR